MRTWLLTQLTIAMIAFAGCAGSVEDSSALEDAEPAQEAAVEQGSGLGSLTGTVLDDEGVGVKGAEVAILEDESTTRSDAQGRFTFNDLEPGTKTVFVQRLGFKSSNARVDVLADQVAEMQLVLIAIAIVEPRTEVVLEAGFVTCATGFPVLTVYPDALGVCSPIVGPDKRTIIIPVDEGTQESYSELVWDPWTTAVGTSLRSVNSFDGDGKGEVSGPSPLTVHEDGYDEGDEGDFQHFLWAAYGSANTGNPGHSVNIIWEQHIDVYFTKFYNTEMPDGYTAVPE